MALGPVNVPGNETAELEDIRRLAETANETANSAKGTSTEAKSTADAALKAANGAASTAGDAKDVANEAKELAQSGKGTAEKALETANAAKETADGMSGKVDEALQTSKNAQDSASSALEAVKKLTSTINAVPSQSGVLVYTGGVLTPTWNNYDPAQLDMTGATSGTDAKEYTVTFTPKSELQWADGTKTGKQVTWKITKATISPPTQSGSLTYTGSPQSPVWSGYDSGKMTIGGVTSGTNAGSYDATATPTANYQWSGGTSDGHLDHREGGRQPHVEPHQSGAQCIFPHENHHREPCRRRSDHGPVRQCRHRGGKTQRHNNHSHRKEQGQHRHHREGRRWHKPHRPDK